MVDLFAFYPSYIIQNISPDYFLGLPTRSPEAYPAMGGRGGEANGNKK